MKFLCSAIFSLCLLQHTVSAQGLDVLVLGADSTAAQDDVKANLDGTGRFNTVTTIDGRSVTPSLATLNTFDAVVTWSNYDYSDSTALGNNLADYVDQGGGVVVMVFSNTSAGARRTLRGRWTSESYFIMEPVSGTNLSAASLGFRYQPSHPLLANVVSFYGGSTAFKGTSSSFSPGMMVVADWTDGTPLILIDETHNAPRVDLNFFPESSNLVPSYWDTNTDGATLMANALEWSAGGGLPELRITDLIPGRYMTFDIQFLSPGNEVITVVSSLGAGPTKSPVGDILVTAPWFQTPRFIADSSGVVNFTTTLPSGASGRTLYSQAIELKGDGTADLSNPVASAIP
ncbi:MAG: hypothetical protein COA70_04435 [Planctomycetota bacterium]|nr:MAG: hypothetical protein COA70_04435 [Planctomycetota bacterium]